MQASNCFPTSPNTCRVGGNGGFGIDFHPAPDLYNLAVGVSVLFNP